MNKSPNKRNENLMSLRPFSEFFNRFQLLLLLLLLSCYSELCVSWWCCCSRISCISCITCSIDMLCSRYCCQSFTFCSARFPSVLRTIFQSQFLSYSLHSSSVCCCCSLSLIICFSCFASNIGIVVIFMLLSFCPFSCGKMKHSKNSFTYVFDGVNFYSTE